MTAKNPADGKVIFNTRKHYHTQATSCRDEKMAYGAQVKAAYIRDTAIQPYKTKEESFEIILPEEFKALRTVDVTVDLYYEINKPDNKAKIHSISRKVSMDR